MDTFSTSVIVTLVDQVSAGLVSIAKGFTQNQQAALRKKLQSTQELAEFIRKHRKTLGITNLRCRHDREYFGIALAML